MDITVISSEMIIDAISNIRNGRMARITYKTLLPLKSEFRKRGISLTKIVDTTARFGVRYENIRSVREMREESPNFASESHNSNYRWVVMNKISYNSNTGKMYVRTTRLPKGSNSKTMYILSINGESEILDTLPTFAKEYVTDSYWKRQSSSEVKNIQFDNIIRIGSVGQHIFEA